MLWILCGITMETSFIQLKFNWKHTEVHRLLAVMDGKHCSLQKWKVTKKKEMKSTRRACPTKKREWSNLWEGREGHKNKTPQKRPCHWSDLHCCEHPWEVVWHFINSARHHSYCHNQPGVPHDREEDKNNLTVLFKDLCGWRRPWDVCWRGVTLRGRHREEGREGE